ncbi:MAG: SDR family oxidoreductase [Verrucomicrobia bacterium]|nr:SDR family oxidoreductase [Verrucomicrobiota bacterium]
MRQLENLNAFVTGAGSGIGRAIALQLAERGARVWVSDRSISLAEAVTKEISENGFQALSAELDVTRAKDVLSMADRVFETDGRLDILVANAGVSSMNHFLDLSEEEWDFNFNVNSKGTFLTIQSFARLMVAQDFLPGRQIRGKIIATASMAARAAAPLLAHYSASKFAVVGLIQAVAKELAKHRVTVNAVNPGFVQTSMQEREIAWEAGLRGIKGCEVINEYLSATPLGRLEQPQDVGLVVAFLASPDSDFMTGEALEVNGGAWIS